LRRQIAVAAAAVAVAWSCSGEVRPEVIPGVDACSRCNMIIDRVNEAAGLAIEDDFMPFDSPVCMLQTLHERRRTHAGDPGVAYVAEYGSGAFRRADSTWFVLTDRVPTVMGGRVLTLGGVEEANGFAEPGDTVSDWHGVRLARGTPDRRVQMALTPSGLEPFVAEAAKGDLVELVIASEIAVVEGVDLTIRGYEDAGVIRIPGSGDAVTFRFFATRPGAGFPVIRPGRKAPVGTVRVTGTHTPDEDAQ
jgi:hypothetical protein